MEYSFTVKLEPEERLESSLRRRTVAILVHRVFATCEIGFCFGLSSSSSSVSSSGLLLPSRQMRWMIGATMDTTRTAVEIGMMTLQGPQDCGGEEGWSAVVVLVSVVCSSTTAGVLVSVGAAPLVDSVVELESTTVLMLLLRRETGVAVGMTVSLVGFFFSAS